MELFIPGRLCLFGEHSDWAGKYRSVNPHIEKGCTLLVGTNQGIHSKIKLHTDKLIIQSKMNDGKTKSIELLMTCQTLLAEARSGNFFSYAAGVAYQILTRYKVGGLLINNYQTDLPIKKGLSSSASICVLVARAFNQLYNLKLSIT